MADAKVQVQLVADTQKFEQDMARATGSVKRASSEISQSLSQVRSVAGALGVSLGLAGLAAALKNIAVRTVDEERSINQLNAALVTTGRSAGQTAASLAKIGDEIQKSTVFDDDSIRKATTALLAFRSVQGDTFEEILRLGPDVATRLGVDLPNAIQVLARAVQHPGEGLKALKAAGVEVSEQQIDLAQRLRETGHNAESARITIDAITRSFGGSAQSDNAGLYGASKRTAKAWDDLVKTLGRKLFGEQGDELDKFAVQLGKIAGLIERIGAASPASAGSGSVAGRLVVGKIGGMEEAEKAWAKQAAATEQSKQDADRAYEKEKVTLRKRAENAATFYTDELHAAQHFLAMESAAYDFAYSENETTIDDFYDHAKDVSERATQEIVANLQKQADAAGAFLDSIMSSPTEKESMRAKIIAAGSQILDARAKDEERQLELDQKRKLALKQLGLAYDELAITVAEAEGRIGDAAAMSFEKSNREQRKQFQATANTGGPGSDKAASAVSAIDALTRRAQTIGDLSAAEQNFGRTLQEVSILQQSIDLKAQSGALTTLEAMRQKEDVARSLIPMLRAEADAYDAQAAKLAAGTPERENAILQSKRLRLEIDALGVAAEATGKMFSDIFTNAFADGLTEIITGTKSVKDAFKDMERSIVQSISRIAAQNIAESIFGKSGAGGGIGSLFASFFGGGTGIGFPTAGFASGTDFAPGGMALVGERGPELVNLPRGAQVIPNNELSARRAATTVNNIHINVNVEGQVNRATADQIGVRAGAAVRRSLARNG